MRILSYALSNILRNRWLSFSSILVLTLLVFFINIFFFLIHGTNYFIETINKRISITLNLKSGYTSENLRVVNLTDQITASFSGIVWKYTSASGALEILRDRDPELALIIQDESDNPLPDTLQIENISINDYERFNTMIAGFQDIIEYDKEKLDRKLNSYTAQYERIHSIVSFLQSVQFSVWALVLLFCLTVGVIMYLIIGNFIFFHSDEIRIIELVGGDNYFLYGPFVVQAGIYSTLASLLAIATTYSLFSGSFLERIFV